MNSTSSKPVRIIRLIKAPRERVFAAWTTPADILQWMGPESCHVLKADIDPRADGQYQYRMKAESGEFDLKGTFREVKNPSRLVYTWEWSGNSSLESGETLVSIDFHEQDQFTEIHLTHDHLTTDQAREDYASGWNGSLDKLEKLVVTSEAVVTVVNGTVCWTELNAKEMPSAEKFYTQLFDWGTDYYTVGNEPCTLFKVGTNRVAGLVMNPDRVGPAMWLPYVRVENVDTTMEKMEKLGGTTRIPPTDVPNVGRIAVFQDPQGAILGVFQAWSA